MLKNFDERTMEKLMEEPDTEIIDSHENWLEMEVRLRKLLHKILKPIIERNVEDRQMSMKNEKNIKSTFETIKEMQKYLYKDRQKEQEEIVKLRL